MTKLKVRNRWALVDEDPGGKWHLHNGCVARKVGDRYQYLHRLVVGAQPGQLVRHLNGDKLDCRRCNLQLVTRSERPQRLRRDNKTGHTGVSIDEGRYRAYITRGGKRYWAGRHDTLSAAIAARKELEREKRNTK